MLGTVHEATVVAALAIAEDQALTDDQASHIWQDGVATWRGQRAARETGRLLATPLDQMSDAQKEALRARLAARQSDARGSREKP
jgi:hypothetical protein